MNSSNKNGLSLEELQDLNNPKLHIQKLLANGEDLDPDSSRILLLQIARMLLDGDELPIEAREFVGHAFWKIVLESASPTKALCLNRSNRGHPSAKGATASSVRDLLRDQKYLKAFLSVEWLECGDRPEEVVNDAIHEAAKKMKVSDRTIRRAIDRKAPTFLILREFTELMGPPLGFGTRAEALEYLLATYSRN